MNIFKERGLVVNEHSARMPRNSDQWYFLIYTRYYEIPKRFPRPEKTFLIVLAMENMSFEGGSTDFMCQKYSKLVKYPIFGRFWAPVGRLLGRLLSHSRLQSAAIAQKVLKVKTRDTYLFKTSKIIKIGSLSQKLQAHEKFGFFFRKKTQVSFTTRPRSLKDPCPALS